MKEKSRLDSALPSSVEENKPRENVLPFGFCCSGSVGINWENMHFVCIWFCDTEGIFSSENQKGK